MNYQKINLSDYGFNILQIETIAACNMACGFCPYPLKKDKISKLDVNNIKDIINQISSDDQNFQYITFSQFNEPLLDNRIFEIIEHTKKSNFQVLLITNGLLLGKERIVEKLMELKPNLKISLQILDSSKHKNARGVNIEIERYLEIIIKFLKKTKNLDMDITIDIGSNFIENKYKLMIKTLFGLSVGDPNLPKNINEAIFYLKKYLKYFQDIADTKYQNIIEDLIDNKKNFSHDYISQKGFHIFNNVKFKIKPFFYGRRISEFFPINNNFSCDTKILGILADGNIVPCCLAYDDSISLGKIYEKSLRDILDNNIFLENLRNNKKPKHLTCRKCFGEPTKLGALVRNIYNYTSFNFREKISELFR
jgi:radical SAM protein with 4Fe4S-binding SPASM domain